MSLVIEFTVHSEKQVVHSSPYDSKIKSESFVKEFPV